MLSPELLSWFAASDAPFMMEVTRRTAADRKGGHLARRLLAQGHQVGGVDLPGSRLEHLGPDGDAIRLFPGSLDEAGVAAWAVRDFQPDGIYHLAGLLT